MHRDRAGTGRHDLKVRQPPDSEASPRHCRESDHADGTGAPAEDELRGCRLTRPHRKQDHLKKEEGEDNLELETTIDGRTRQTNLLGIGFNTPEAFGPSKIRVTPSASSPHRRSEQLARLHFRLPPAVQLPGAERRPGAPAVAEISTLSRRSTGTGSARFPRP